MKTDTTTHQKVTSLADAEKVTHAKVGSYADQTAQSEQQGNDATLHNAIEKNVNLAFLVKHLEGKIAIAIKAKHGDLSSLKFKTLPPELQIVMDELTGGLLVKGKADTIQNVLEDMVLTLPQDGITAFNVSIVQGSTMVLQTNLIFHADPLDSSKYRMYADNKSASTLKFFEAGIQGVDSHRVWGDNGFSETDFRLFVSTPSKNVLSRENLTGDAIRDRGIIQDNTGNSSVTPPVNDVPVSVLPPSSPSPTPTPQPVPPPTPEPVFVPPVILSPAPPPPPVTTNTAPVILDFTRNGTEDVNTTFTLANFTAAYSDADAHALSSITVVNLPANGDLKLSGVNITAGQVISAANIPNITFVPTANWNGSTTFDWRASDGTDLSNTQTVTITLAAVNDAPDAVDNAVSIFKGTTSINLAATLLGNDTDPDTADTRTITAVDTTGTLGVVTFNAGTQTLTFTANDATHLALTAGQTATTSFTYTITDAGGLTDTATVTLTITGTNTAPDAVNDTVSVNEDATTANLVATLLGNDTDLDTGDTRTITSVNTTGTVGTVSFNAGAQTLTFAADNNAHDSLAVGQSATTSFTYTITDAGGLTDTATVTMTINGVNDAPVVGAALVDQYYNVANAFSYQFAAGSFTDIDATDTLTYTAEYWDGAAWAALPAWLTFTAATRTFSASAGAATMGLYDVRVTATDTHGAAVTDVFELGVGDFVGGAGSDFLQASISNNVIFGLANHDTIYGYAGDDRIYGQVGSDHIFAGAGNDTIYGGSEPDSINGGEGADIIYTGAGNDRISFYSYTESTIANPDIIMDWDPLDFITVTGFNAIGAAPAAGLTLQQVFDGTYTVVSGANGFGFKVLGNHDLTARMQYLATMGTAGDDTITGTTVRDGVMAGAGNDMILLNDGDDIAFGEDGNDTINSGQGADTLTGGAGNDVYVIDIISSLASFSSSNASRDTITDFVRGQDRIDMSALPITAIVAGTPSNTFEIGYVYDAAKDITVVSGHTLLIGNSGHYIQIYLEGNIALDASDFIFAANTLTDADDNITGTVGPDVYLLMGGNDTVSLGDGNDRATGTSGNKHINLGNGDNAYWGGAGIDTVIGGSGADQVFDNSATNYIFTRGGDDHVRPITNNTVIGVMVMGAGNDTVSGGAGGTVYGGEGNDNITTYHGISDLIYGDAGNDTLNAQGGNDTIWGGSGNDSIWGGLGNDSIIGGYGADTLRGGNPTPGGQDLFVYLDINESTITERDQIGGVAGDFIVGNGVNSGKIVIYGFTGIAEGAAAGLTLGYSFAGGFTTITSSAGYSFSLNFLGNFTSGSATPFDIPNDFEFRPGILGTMGADNAGTFATTAGYDHVMGLEGNDTINAGDGDDSVFGGHDNDQLNGEGGNDFIVGGYGVDTMDGGAGADTLEGSTGADIFKFSDLTHSTSAAADVILDFLSAGEADKIELTGLGITGFGAGAAELTVSYQNEYTLISHNSSTFQIKLIGYWELGVDFFATDFTF